MQGIATANRTGVGAALVVAMLTLTACAGVFKREPRPDPARGVRLVGADDADLLPISFAAAALVKVEAQGNTVGFYAVLVNERLQRALTDSLVRHFGFIKSESRRGVAVLKAGRHIVPPVYTFEIFRATADSAYVGGTKMSLSPQGSKTFFCVVLGRAQGAWDPVRRGTIDRFEHCGR